MEDNNIKDYGFTWNLAKFFRSLKYVSQFQSPEIRVSASSYIQFFLIHKDRDSFEIKIEKSENLELSLGDCEVSTTETPSGFSKKRCSELPGWSVQWRSSMNGTDADLKIALQLFLREHLNSNYTLSSSDAISFKKLSVDMKRMFNTGTFYDLELVIGDEEFKVHKGILSARAPKLIDILELGISNSRISIKEVTFVAAPVLKLILRYLYTGEFDINQTEAQIGLSPALNVLKLDPLKSKLYAYPNHTTMSTHMQTAVHSFVWPIENFSDLPTETILSSPIIHPHSLCELQLRLRKESVRDADDEEVVRVFLALDTNCERENCHIHIDIYVMDIFGDCTRGRSFDMGDAEWYKALSIKMSELTLHPGDTLSLLCKLTTRRLENEIAGSEFSSTALSTCYASTCDLPGLGDDLYRLYQSGKFSDLTVEAGDRKFKVHKAIISARSPKLLESFEIQKNLFGPSSAIVDIEPSVLEKLFEYIYSGRAVQSNCASATKLYLSAYKYDLSPLKVNCLSYIKSNITF